METVDLTKLLAALSALDQHDVNTLAELADMLTRTKDEKINTVEKFISRYCANNGDGFYTPYENTFKTTEEAIADYNSKWNQNRSPGEQPMIYAGDRKEIPDPNSCGEEVCDHPEHEAPHPKMRSYLELPYGHICPHCGGSMIAIIQLDEHGNVLKTLLEDCG